MLDRDKQIEFLEQVEERFAGHMEKWLQNDEFLAALHRYDHEVDGNGEHAQTALAV